MALKCNKIIYGGETLIDLTGDTVTAPKLFNGITAHAKDGSIITGTATGKENMKLQAKTATPTKNSQLIKPDATFDGLSQMTVNAIPYSSVANEAGGNTVTIG